MKESKYHGKTNVERKGRGGAFPAGPEAETLSPQCRGQSDPSPGRGSRLQLTVPMLQLRPGTKT